MHPDLVAEFMAEYQREWNRLHKETLGARAELEAELKTVERQIRPASLSAMPRAVAQSTRAAFSTASKARCRSTAMPPIAG